VQGPERYLNELGITLPCAVDPALPAIIDARHRALVNHEAYFFSSDDALRAFVAEPYRYTGKVTDPVSLVRFAPTASSPTRSHGGRLFYFTSNETVAKFDADRVTYGTPRPMMREKT
jgi:YHS domain-containing protein